MALNSLKTNKASTGVDDNDFKSDSPFCQQCRAIIYQHGDFTGWSAYFTEGEYNGNKFQAVGARNDDASSIKVRGNENCCAVVYEHGDFSGWAAEFKPGDH